MSVLKHYNLTLHAWLKFSDNFFSKSQLFPLSSPLLKPNPRPQCRPPPLLIDRSLPVPIVRRLLVPIVHRLPRTIIPIAGCLSRAPSAFPHRLPLHAGRRSTPTASQSSAALLQAWSLKADALTSLLCKDEHEHCGAAKSKHGGAVQGAGPREKQRCRSTTQQHPPRPTVLPAPATSLHLPTFLATWCLPPVRSSTPSPLTHRRPLPLVGEIGSPSMKKMRGSSAMKKMRERRRAEMRNPSLFFITFFIVDVGDILDKEKSLSSQGLDRTKCNSCQFRELKDPATGMFDQAGMK